MAHHGDAGDRPTVTTGGDGSNGDGQRVQKIDSTGTTNHIWDGQNILLETDGNNIVQVMYTLEPAVYGNLVSQLRSETTSYHLFDGMGSTVQLTDNLGALTDCYVYDSFGNTLVCFSDFSSYISTSIC